MGKPSSDIDPAGLGPPLRERLEIAPRAPLLWVLLGLIAGYVLASRAPFQPPSPALFVSAAGMLALAWWKRASRGFWGCAFLMAVALVAWIWARERQTQSPPVWESLPPREIVAEARMLEVYPGRTYPDRQYALVELEDVPALMSELEGQRAFASLKHDDAHPLLRSGEIHRLRGVLAPVEPEPGNGFNQLLAARGAHFRIRQGAALARLQAPPAWRHQLEALGARWTGWLTAAPARHADEGRLLGAMLMGERTLLDPTQESAFLLSGTMHLFAISGLHVMLVALTLQQGLNLLRVPRRIGFVIVLCLLGLYVGATGFSPSAVRAASMMAFYWMAGILGRRPRPLPAVVASAVVVLLIQPSQLWEIGFQLSYSVVLGILLLGLPLSERWGARRTPFAFVLKEELKAWQRAVVAGRKRAIDSLCISFSATIASAPLIVLHFGVWTPGAIVLNAILVPLASLVVATGVLIVLSHTVGLAALGGLLLHGAWLLLLAMEAIVERATTVPGVYGERQWAGPGAAYLVLTIFLLGLLLLPESGRGGRLSPVMRHGLPVAWALFGLWLGTTAV